MSTPKVVIDWDGTVTEEDTLSAALRLFVPAAPDGWKIRWLSTDVDPFVADNDNGETVGWIAASPEGYIDMIFCLPEAVGRRVAAALYAASERTAIGRGLTQLTAHASLLAQPFLSATAGQSTSTKRFVRNGVEIPRALMSKRLSGRVARSAGAPSSSMCLSRCTVSQPAASPCTTMIDELATS